MKEALEYQNGTLFKQLIMKKILMSAAVCAMLLGTSCQNEEIVKQVTTEEFTLKLDMGANSRTMMSENGPVW